jgi:hypothetical protein
MDEFIAWYCSEPRLALGRIVVTRFRMSLEARGLASSSINERLAAVRRLAYEAADCGLLSPDLAAGIRRVKGCQATRPPLWQLADVGTGAVDEVHAAQIEDDALVASGQQVADKVPQDGAALPKRDVVSEVHDGDAIKCARAVRRHWRPLQRHYIT